VFVDHRLAENGISDNTYIRAYMRVRVLDVRDGYKRISAESTSHVYGKSWNFDERFQMRHRAPGGGVNETSFVQTHAKLITWEGM